VHSGRRLQHQQQPGNPNNDGVDDGAAGRPDRTGFGRRQHRRADRGRRAQQIGKAPEIGTCDHLLMDLDNPEQRSGSVYLAPRSHQVLSAREFIGANRFGAILGAIAGAIGICVGVAATVIALIPSSALWMSGIACISGYRLAYNQLGQSVGYHCVSGDSAYDVNDVAVYWSQAVLAALVLCLCLIGSGLIRARLRKA
jgi:hypothetical protein